MNKSTLIYFALIPAMLGAETVDRRVTVENPIGSPRTDAPVVVEIAKLKCPFEVQSVTVRCDGEEIPSQLDDLNRDNINEEIALVIDLGAKESKTLDITLSTEPTDTTYAPRTFAQMLVRGRKTPENILDISVDGNVKSYSLLQGHGVMFESELNGYRIYFDPKQTLDPYGKFHKRLELKESGFYPNDKQLADGFGDDVLLVGQSCGIGALKGWDGKEATHVEPVKRRAQRVLATGPVRAVVETLADGWPYDGKVLNMRQRYTQWAGHRDVEIDVNFDRSPSHALFAAGVMNIKGNETSHAYGPKGTVASWGRHWPVNDTIKYGKEIIGIATYVPEKIVKAKAQDSNGFYYTLSIPGQKHFVYHTMFTSGKESFGYAGPDEWFAILPAWKEELDNPVIVKYSAVGKQK